VFFSSEDHLPQDTVAGTDAAVFHNKLHTLFKVNWATESAVGSGVDQLNGTVDDLQFGEVMRYILRHLFDPTNSSLLDPDGSDNSWALVLT
jgi:hypothetical protein